MLVLLFNFPRNCISSIIISFLVLYNEKQINLFFLMKEVHFISWVPSRPLPYPIETRNSFPFELDLFIILSTHSMYVSVSLNYHQKQHYQLPFVVNIVINKVTCHVVVHIIIYEDGRLVFSFYGSKIEIKLF